MMTVDVVIAGLLPIVIVALTIANIAKNYRYLPRSISLKPSYGALAPYAPRLVIWLVPIVQVAIVLVEIAAKSGRLNGTHISSLSVLLVADVGIATLAFAQYGLIQSAKEDQAP